MLKIDLAIYTSLIVAILAQILNAFFSNKREDKKILKSILDNYVAPNISSILNFTAKISLNHYQEKCILNDLRTNVEPILKNIEYGDENLFLKRIEEDNKYNSLDVYDVEEQEITRKLEIQLFFLIYSLKILKKLKVKLHSQVGHSINHSIRVHTFLITSRKLYKYDEGYNNLISITRFNFDSLSIINESDMRKLRKNLWDEKILNKVYNVVNDDFQQEMQKKFS